MAKRSATTELERLKSENDRLLSENNELKELAKRSKYNKSEHKRNWPRLTLVSILIALSVALLSFGNIFFWLGNTVVDTDRYVDTVSPLIEDPKVQESISTYAVDKIFSNIDVQQHLVEVLPPRADFLAPSLSDQLKIQTENIFYNALSNPDLQASWNEVQKNQHERLINFAANYQGDGTININEVYNRLSSKLKDTRLSFLTERQLPPEVGQMTVIETAWLPVFSTVVNNIDTWRALAILGLVVSLALAVWLSKNKRRTIYIYAVTTTTVLFLTLVAIRVLVEQSSNQVEPAYSEGARRAAQIITDPLRFQTFIIMFLLLITGVIAWVSGTSKNAVSFKNWIADSVSGKLHHGIFGSKEYGFTKWIRKYKRSLEWIAVAIFAAVLLSARVTLETILYYSAILLVIIALIEVISLKPKS